jgi:hypothetical protein
VEQGRCGSYGWMAIGAFVVGWDVLANETLSHAAKRGLENNYTAPLVAAAIGVTALHLLDVLPEQIDPFTMAISRLRSNK